MYLPKGELRFDILYQGDVLSNFPFFIIPEKIKVLDKNKNDNSFVIKDNNVLENEEQLVAITAKFMNVMILSQTCDVKYRENIIIAPVYTLQMFQDSGILTVNKIESVRKRKYYWLFYLPKSENVIEDSVVYFQAAHYLPKNFVNNYKNNKIASLSDWGRHHLGWALSNYFGRPIEDKYS